ncbi:hypothetical protein Pcinc_029842 [Petrolisthes cinctipes]|uniref:Uncharacterized protein n=1 Tax=Petrolisthes cinctipes TaxID=88211 RepID=A0AAE1F049_PETCI|nr:hypothetical protein Pcinc_029842 [Petrolisthes cinctipes]
MECLTHKVYKAAVTGTSHTHSAVATANTHSVMKLLVLVLLAVAACASDVEKREAEPGYKHSGYRYHYTPRYYSHHYGKRSAEPEPEPEPEAEADPGYVTYYRPSHSYNPKHYGKRSADPEPEADPGYVTYSRPSYSYRPKHYGKRSADPEPEADPGYVSRYHPSYSYRPSYSYHPKHYGKRSADPEPEASHGYVSHYNTKHYGKSSSSRMGGGVEAKYGSWKSPISSHLVTRSGNNKVKEDPQVDPVTGKVVWSESVGTEKGRNAVFYVTPGKSEVMRWTPPGYNVRTRVHEYGGGAFTVYNNTVFFSNAIDDALYKQEGPGPDSQPSRLTPPSKKRYADGVYWQLKKALVVVVEDHHQEGREAVTTLTLVDVNTGIHTILAHQGADFFSSPAVSHTSNRLAWIQWCHPEMPWGKTKLCVAEVTKENQVNILFSQQTGSMLTPMFDVNDDLYYIHDQTGWWNLYKLTDNFTKQTNLTPESREVGWAAWQ